MQTFFTNIENIKSEIALVDCMLSQVKGIHHQSLDAITDEQQAKASSEQEELIAKIQSKNRQIQEMLKIMDLETKDLKAKNHPEVPIREAQYAVSLKLFCDTIQNVKQVQEDHQQRIKERLTKHVMVVNPNATQQDIDRVIQGEKIFAPQNSQQRAEARAALDEIQKKHRDVTKLTESILVRCLTNLE